MQLYQAPSFYAHVLNGILLAVAMVLLYRYASIRLVWDRCRWSDWSCCSQWAWAFMGYLIWDWNGCTVIVRCH